MGKLLTSVDIRTSCLIAIYHEQLSKQGKQLKVIMDNQLLFFTIKEEATIQPINFAIFYQLQLAVQSGFASI